MKADSLDFPRHRRPARSSGGRPSAAFIVFTLLALLRLDCAQAREWIVDAGSGVDSNGGSPEAPLATIQAAVDKAGPGDRVVLRPAGAIYRQSVDLGGAPVGLILDGAGATLSGAEPIPAESWERLADGRFRARFPASSGEAPRLFDREGRPLDAGRIEWEAVDASHGLLTVKGPVEGLERSVREQGLFALGAARNVKIFQLAVRHCRGDGFAISGESRGFQFFGVVSEHNGGAGFAASGRAECWIRGGRFESNRHGLVSAEAAETFLTECRAAGNAEGAVRLEGGRHTLTGCRLGAGPNGALLSLRGTTAGRQGDGVASLVVQSLGVEPVEGVARPRFEVGAGSFVYHDGASAEALAALEVDVQPGGEISESLYHTYPIGRDASGAPITAWAGGGTRYLPSNAYRIIHFGKHVPQEVAPKLSPDNDWLGLLAPLDTAAFPPAGPAFAPEHSSAHAIWRWIGLAAPDAVFVPDTREGRALGEALRVHPPAGVGMVDVFLQREGRDGSTEAIVLPRLDGATASAKEEMLARVMRSPTEVLHQLAANYGDRFGGSYIEALAVIARAEGGLSHRAAELAKAQLERKPELPGNGGEIAGTLLYAMVEEDWAKARVLAVADMAFDAEGKPLEAMPTHNEMSDAVFMASPILAEAGRLSGEGRYFDQALRNYRFIAGLCRRPDGIYRHSPLDEAAWGRGNGFPALGLALTLRSYPKDREGYAEMRDALVAHLAALARHQDRDGMWHQVIDHPDSYAELTATAMIAYAIACAIEEGWLEEAEWRPRLEAAWATVKMHAATDGGNFVNVCTGTGKQRSLEDYYLREAILGPDGRGAAMTMLLASKLKSWQHR